MDEQPTDVCSIYTITNSIKNIILSSDLSILSGAISVGDYDFVNEA